MIAHEESRTYVSYDFHAEYVLRSGAVKLHDSSGATFQKEGRVTLTRASGNGAHFATFALAAPDTDAGALVRGDGQFLGTWGKNVKNNFKKRKYLEEMQIWGADNM